MNSRAAFFTLKLFHSLQAISVKRNPLLSHAACLCLCFAFVNGLVLTANARQLPQPAIASGFVQEKKSQVLEPGKPLQREMKPDESHSYTLALIEKQFVYALIAQRGIDIAVTLLGPDGAKLLEVDSPGGVHGPERLLWIAEQSGNYRIEIHATKKSKLPGRYEVKLSPLREATTKDASFVTAEKLFAEAEILRARKNVDSVRQAVLKYEEALPHFRTAGDPHREAETLTTLGVVYAQLGEPQKALKYYSQVFSLTKDSKEVVNVQKIIDLYYTFDRDDRLRSLAYVKQVLSLLRITGDRYMEVYPLIGIGFINADLGETQQALDHFQQALKLARSTGNKLGEAYTLTHLGNVYSRLGENQKSLEHFDQAVPLFHALKDEVGERYVLGSIGSIYFYLGEDKKAIDYFNKELAIGGPVGSALMNLGVVYETMGQRDKALEYYQKVLKMAREIEVARYYEASALESIADIYVEQKLYKEALENYQQALDIWQDLGFRQLETSLIARIGRTYNFLGRHQESLTYLNRALARDREAKARSSEASTLTNLMSVWAALNKSRLAVFYGKQAVNIYQEIRSNIREMDKDLQKNFVKSREKTYRKLAELLVAEGRLPEAQQVIGLLKEEEYFDFVRRDGSEADTLNSRATLNEKEATWEKRYLEISDSVTAISKQRGELLSKNVRTAEDEQLLSKLNAEMENAGRAFQRFLDQLATEFSDTKQAARVEQIRESQGLMEDLRELGNGAVALYTIIGEEKYRVILVTPDVQKAYDYPIKAAELNAKVMAFREVLQNPQEDPRPLAEELYKILLGPVAKDLKNAKAETLMWSLDGVLRYVPMAALYDGDKFMVERYRNVVFTMASNSRLKDVPTPKWKGLGLGVSKAQEGFRPLPAVPEELRGIIRDEGGAPSTGILPGKVMLDEAFNEETMRAALRQRYPLVHIASHFAFRPGKETDSFLLLGDGQRLTLAQIKTSQNLFGGVELLTLSACDTAMGGGGGADGKEVEGFGMLAQRQGAKAVVASLWPVADKSTQLMMQNFYRIRETQAGIMKSEALRRAQLIMLRGQDARYEHPYYWAPFILIGNWK